MAHFPLFAKTAALLGLLCFSGCASVPRPVPVASAPVASAQVAGVTIHVPRLGPDDYPGDVLEEMTPVLVVIENRSQSEILINPDGFVLVDPSGAQNTPLRPEPLALKLQKKEETTAEQPLLLAWRGRGGGFRSAPTYRGPSGGGVRVSPPAYRSGGSFGHRGGFGHSGYSGRSGYYGRSGHYGRSSYYSRPGYYRRSGYLGRPRMYARPFFIGAYPWLWGNSYGLSWYGSSFWIDQQGPINFSGQELVHMALPEGRLPPGGRTGGFLYFPKLPGGEGTSLTLGWQIRDSSGQQVLGDVAIPLEFTEEQ